MELVSSIESYTPRLEAVLAERYEPHLRPGEASPDYRLALDLAAREVEAALARVVELDDAVTFATSDLAELRRQRDRLVDGELYPRAVTVRGSIELAFGREQGRELHSMEGRTRRKGPGLERQLRRTVARLSDPDHPLPAARNPHAEVDRAGWIRQLQPLYLELVRLNQALSGTESALTRLFDDKQIAMEAFDVAYSDTLRYARTLFQMAGFDARALRNLQPYSRRRRLSRRARKAREARAAATAAGKSMATVEAHPATKEAARVAIPRAIARWLERSRLFGR